MGTDDFDELEPRNGGTLPQALHNNATHTEMVKAINTLAVEAEGIRAAVRELGTRLETFCVRIEKALEARHP